jgi:hypothetical protein
MRPKSRQSSTQNLNKKQRKIRIEIIKEFTKNRISVRFNPTPTSTQRQGKKSLTVRLINTQHQRNELNGKFQSKTMPK